MGDFGLILSSAGLQLPRLLIAMAHLSIWLVNLASAHWNWRKELFLIHQKKLGLRRIHLFILDAIHKRVGFTLVDCLAGIVSWCAAALSGVTITPISSGK